MIRCGSSSSSIRGGVELNRATGQWNSPLQQICFYLNKESRRYITCSPLLVPFYAPDSLTYPLSLLCKDMEENCSPHDGHQCMVVFALIVHQLVKNDVQMRTGWKQWEKRKCRLKCWKEVVSCLDMSRMADDCGTSERGGRRGTPSIRE